MTKILSLQQLASDDPTTDEMPLSTLSWSHCSNTN